MGFSYSRLLQTYSGDVYDFSAKYDSYTLMLASYCDTLTYNLANTKEFLNTTYIALNKEIESSYHYGYFFGFVYDPNTYSFAEGKVNSATGKYSHAEGFNTISTDISSHAEGYNTIACDKAAHAEGRLTYAFGFDAHAEGYNTYALNNQAHAEGIQTYAHSSASHAEGGETQTTNYYAHAEGHKTYAGGKASHAEGEQTIALSDYSHTEGYKTYTNGINAHAEGYKTYALGQQSHAEGQSNYVYGKNAHAEGENNIAYADYSHVEGSNNIATNKANYTHIEGYGSYVDSPFSHVDGYYNHSYGWGTTVSGIGNIAYSYQTVIGKYNVPDESKLVLIGYGSNINDKKTAFAIDKETGLTYVIGIQPLSAPGSYNQYFAANGTIQTLPKSGHIYDEEHDSLIEGINQVKGTINIATGNRSHAEGVNTKAYGHGSHVEGINSLTGDSSKVCGTAAHAEGYATQAKGNYSHAEGYNTLSIADYSHAEGYNTIACDNYSHAEGRLTYAFGFDAHAEGYNTYALNNQAHAEGTQTYAHKGASHAEGSKTQAANLYAHSEGHKTYAGGQTSHAEGEQTTAYGDNSHTEGYKTYTGNNSAHAEGSITKANGQASHAEGSETIAQGHYSHTEGDNTIAHGKASHAEGVYTYAKGYAQHVSGKYNEIIGDEALFIIGNGTSDVKSNIFVAYQSYVQTPKLITNQTTIGNIDITNNTITNGNLQLTATGISYTTDDANKKYFKADGSIGYMPDNGHIYNATYDSLVEGITEPQYLNVAYGFRSHAEGFITVATGEAAHAEGRNTYASGNGSHSEGRSAGSLSLLNKTINANDVTFQLSNDEIATEWVGQHIALKKDNLFYARKIISANSEDNSITIDAPFGVATTTDSLRFINHACGTSSHAEGNIAYAGGAASHAEGTFTAANGNASHAEGKWSFANSECSHAEGEHTTTDGKASHAEGIHTIAVGDYSHASGYYTTAYNDAQTVVGKYNMYLPSSYNAYFVVGVGTETTNKNALTVCEQITYLDGDLLLSGNIKTFNGIKYIGSEEHDSKHVFNTEGGITYIDNLLQSEGHYYDSSKDSLAEGSDASMRANVASGKRSHAEGIGSVAETLASHAEGYNTKVEKITNSSGYGAHAEGKNSIAYGEAAHAEGCCTNAYSDYSHSEGYATQAISYYSHAEGLCTYAAADCQHVQGKYNKKDSAKAFIIGGGTGPNDVNRKNIFTVDWLGYTYLNGIKTTNPDYTASSEYCFATDGSIQKIGTGAVTSAKVNGTIYNPVNGVVTFTTPDTKVTEVGNHYKPSNGSAKTVTSSGMATRNSTVAITGIKTDAAGHITEITGHTFPNSDNTDTKNTAGASTTQDTIYLIGAKSKSGTPETYTSATNIYATNGTVYASAFYETSDKRLKNIHQEIDLNKAYQLLDTCSTIIYDLKDDPTHKEQVGMIAQEVEEFFPEIVTTDEQGFKSIDYTRLSVILLRLIKDLANRVNKLENK